MPRYTMIAMTRPHAGREAEFDDWYLNTHLDEVCSIPGIKSAQLYKLATKLVEGDVAPYLCVYQIEADSPDATVQELLTRPGNGMMNLTDAMDPATAFASIFEEFGPLVKART